MGLAPMSAVAARVRPSDRVCAVGEAAWRPLDSSPEAFPESRQLECPPPLRGQAWPLPCPGRLPWHSWGPARAAPSVWLLFSSMLAEQGVRRSPAAAASPPSAERAMGCDAAEPPRVHRPLGTSGLISKRRLAVELHDTGLGGAPFPGGAGRELTSTPWGHLG